MAHAQESTYSHTSAPARQSPSDKHSHILCLLTSILGLASTIAAVVLCGTHALPSMQSDIKQDGNLQSWTCASDFKGKDAEGQEISLPPGLAKLCGDAETAYILMYVLLSLEVVLLGTGIVGMVGEALESRAVKKQTRDEEI
ncbi:hypothetical protein KEM55_002022 [Ascosphaera atra]|nr:hypothetical protein KEM55_002022 [Ascosphaera atra]